MNCKKCGQYLWSEEDDGLCDNCRTVYYPSYPGKINFDFNDPETLHTIIVILVFLLFTSIVILISTINGFMF